MLCNLPVELQLRKLEILKNTISKNLGVNPVSFRAGRWALGNNVARAIHKLGFKIDTSVTPYTEWTKWHGVDYRNCTPRPYRFSSEKILKSNANGELLQVPATIAFLQKNHQLCGWLSRVVDTNVMKKIHARGILYRLNILNKVFLSPEIATGQSIIQLAKRMKNLGFDVLNLFFHSTTLLPGCSPFNNNPNEEKIFLQHIEKFLEYAASEGIESIMLKDLLRS